MKRSRLDLLILTCAFGLLTGCGASSSSGGAAAEADEATYTIDLAGGKATNGAGGAGGRCSLMSYSDLSIKRSGTVDASFEIPSPNIDLGERICVVTPTTTVKVDVIAGAVIPKGTYYIPLGGANIYISDGDAEVAEADEVYATGLKIEAGATLEFHAGVALNLEKGAIIEGAIKTNGFDFELVSTADSIFVGPQGQIDTRGPKDGGKLRLLVFSTPGVTTPLQMLGSLNANGANGANDGFAAGQIYISTGVNPIYLAGSITASGGQGLAGKGGMTGGVRITSANSSVMNKASITASGGDGTTQGGSCLPIDIGAGSQSTGTVVNAGQLTVNGGNGASGPGGNSGGIYLQTYGGEVKSSGKLNAKGGSSASGAGGQGGSLTIWLLQDYPNGNQKGPGSVSLSGDISLGGGQGFSGGAGGEFVINAPIDPLVQTVLPAGKIELLGYSAIGLKGGSGVPGGQGGWFLAYTKQVGIGSGAILNEAAIDARGGDGLGTTGGLGGRVEFHTHEQNASASLTNTGSLSIAGGSGASGGQAGPLLVLSGWGIASGGELSACGGAAASGQAGDASWVSFYNTKAATVISGKVYARGGSASGAAKAGNAATIDVNGLTIKVTGTLDASGGAAAAKADCGKGGTIKMTSTPNGPNYLNAALLTILNGDGSWDATNQNFIFANGNPIPENTGKYPK